MKNSVPGQRYLYHLINPVDQANKYIAEKRHQLITDFAPGDDIYVDMRVFLQLSDSHLITYVAQFKCTHWFHKSSKKEIISS